MHHTFVIPVLYLPPPLALHPCSFCNLSLLLHYTPSFALLFILHYTLTSLASHPCTTLSFIVHYTLTFLALYSGSPALHPPSSRTTPSCLAPLQCSLSQFSLHSCFCSTPGLHSLFALSPSSLHSLSYTPVHRSVCTAPSLLAVFALHPASRFLPNNCLQPPIILTSRLLPLKLSS